MTSEACLNALFLLAAVKNKGNFLWEKVSGREKF